MRTDTRATSSAGATGSPTRAPAQRSSIHAIAPGTYTPTIGTEIAEHSGASHEPVAAPTTHQVIIGYTGTGRTAMVRARLAQHLHQGGRAYVFDKAHSHVWAMDVPNCTVYRTLSEIETALTRLDTEIGDRYNDLANRITTYNRPNLLVAIEDLPILRRRLNEVWTQRHPGRHTLSPAVRALNELFTTAGHVGIHVVATSGPAHPHELGFSTTNDAHPGGRADITNTAWTVHPGVSGAQWRRLFGELPRPQEDPHVSSRWRGWWRQVDPAAGHVSAPLKGMWLTGRQARDLANNHPHPATVRGAS